MQENKTVLALGAAGLVGSAVGILVAGGTDICRGNQLNSTRRCFKSASLQQCKYLTLQEDPSIDIGDARIFSTIMQ